MELHMQVLRRIFMWDTKDFKVFLNKKDVQHIEDVMQISEVKYSKINTK